jgi:hypothetical protein
MGIRLSVSGLPGVVRGLLSQVGRIQKSRDFHQVAVLELHQSFGDGPHDIVPITAGARAGDA